MTMVTAYDWESDTWTHNGTNGTNGATNGHTPGASAFDADLDALYSWFPPQSAPQPLPAARFALTLKGTISGVDAMITVRAMTSEEFTRNVQSVKGLLDAPASPQGQPQGQDETPQCPEHGAKRASTKGKGWYCPHKLADGSWCKA